MGKVIMFDEARAVRRQFAGPAQARAPRSARGRHVGPFAPAETARVVEGATTFAWWPVTFGLRLWEQSLAALGAAADVPQPRRDGARARHQ